MSHFLFERHQPLLQQAVQAIRSRAYWSAYPESASPKNYGESAAAEGKAAFEARLERPFALEQAGRGAGPGTKFRRTASRWASPIRSPTSTCCSLRSRPRRSAGARPGQKRGPAFRSKSCSD